MMANKCTIRLRHVLEPNSDVAQRQNHLLTHRDVSSHPLVAVVLCQRQGSFPAGTNSPSSPTRGK